MPCYTIVCFPYVARYEKAIAWILSAKQYNTKIKDPQNFVTVRNPKWRLTSSKDP